MKLNFLKNKDPAKALQSGFKKMKTDFEIIEKAILENRVTHEEIKLLEKQNKRFRKLRFFFKAFPWDVNAKEVVKRVGEKQEQVQRIIAELRKGNVNEDLANEIRAINQDLMYT